MPEREVGGNSRNWRLDDHERRIGNIERLELAVVVNRLASVEKRVDSMTKALWAVAGAIIIAVITFALSIASGAIG